MTEPTQPQDRPRPLSHSWNARARRALAERVFSHFFLDLSFDVARDFATPRQAKDDARKVAILGDADPVGSEVFIRALADLEPEHADGVVEVLRSRASTLSEWHFVRLVLSFAIRDANEVNERGLSLVGRMPFESLRDLLGDELTCLRSERGPFSRFVFAVGVGLFELCASVRSGGATDEERAAYAKSRASLLSSTAPYDPNDPSAGESWDDPPTPANVIDARALTVSVGGKAVEGVFTSMVTIPPFTTHPPRPVDSVELVSMSATVTIPDTSDAVPVLGVGFEYGDEGGLGLFRMSKDAPCSTPRARLFAYLAMYCAGLDDSGFDDGSSRLWRDASSSLHRLTGHDIELAALVVGSDGSDVVAQDLGEISPTMAVYTPREGAASMYRRLFEGGHVQSAPLDLILDRPSNMLDIEEGGRAVAFNPSSPLFRRLDDGSVVVEYIPFALVVLTLRPNLVDTVSPTRANLTRVFEKLVARLDLDVVAMKVRTPDDTSNMCASFVFKALTRSDLVALSSVAVVEQLAQSKGVPTNESSFPVPVKLDRPLARRLMALPMDLQAAANRRLMAFGARHFADGQDSEEMFADHILGTFSNIENTNRGLVEAGLSECSDEVEVAQALRAARLIRMEDVTLDAVEGLCVFEDADVSQYMLLTAEEDADFVHIGNTGDPYIVKGRDGREWFRLEIPLTLRSRSTATQSTWSEDVYVHRVDEPAAVYVSFSPLALFSMLGEFRPIGSGSSPIVREKLTTAARRVLSMVRSSHAYAYSAPDLGSFTFEDFSGFWGPLVTVATFPLSTDSEGWSALAQWVDDARYNVLDSGRGGSSQSVDFWRWWEEVGEPVATFRESLHLLHTKIDSSGIYPEGKEARAHATLGRWWEAIQTFSGNGVAGLDRLIAGGVHGSPPTRSGVTFRDHGSASADDGTPRLLYVEASEICPSLEGSDEEPTPAQRSEVGGVLSAFAERLAYNPRRASEGSRGFIGSYVYDGLLIRFAHGEDSQEGGLLVLRTSGHESVYVFPYVLSDSMCLSIGDLQHADTYLAAFASTALVARSEGDLENLLVRVAKLQPFASAAPLSEALDDPTFEAIGLSEDCRGFVEFGRDAFGIGNGYTDESEIHHKEPRGILTDDPELSPPLSFALALAGWDLMQDIKTRDDDDDPSGGGNDSNDDKGNNEDNDDNASIQGGGDSPRARGESPSNGDGSRVQEEGESSGDRDTPRVDGPTSSQDAREDVSEDEHAPSVELAKQSGETSNEEPSDESRALGSECVCDSPFCAAGYRLAGSPLQKRHIVMMVTAVQISERATEMFKPESSCVAKGQVQDFTYVMRQVQAFARLVGALDVGEFRRRYSLGVESRAVFSVPDSTLVFHVNFPKVDAPVLAAVFDPTTQGLLGATKVLGAKGSASFAWYGDTASDDRPFDEVYECSTLDVLFQNPTDGGRVKMHPFRCALDAPEFLGLGVPALRGSSHAIANVLTFLADFVVSSKRVGMVEENRAALLLSKLSSVSMYCNLFVDERQGEADSLDTYLDIVRRVGALFDEIGILDASVDDLSAALVSDAFATSMSTKNTTAKA